VPVFPLLIDADSYTPCDWDLLADAQARAYWLDLFDSQIESLTHVARLAGVLENTCEQIVRSVRACVAQLRDNPRALGDRLDILALDRMRDGIFRDAGVDDACRAIKSRESRVALDALPERLAALKAIVPADLPLALVQGIFAGNMFDMGAPLTAARFHNHEQAPAFASLLHDVKPRPWLIDNLDILSLENKRKALLFVDNAGADAALGALPLALALDRAGCDVVFAANEAPALNDITARELRELLNHAHGAGVERAGALRVVSTGSGDPLLDLSAVSRNLCDQCAGVDLIVFFGMGRALESNWASAFTCETWRLAVIKDPIIAARRGGELYDCVCSVTPAGSAPSPVHQPAPCARPIAGRTSDGA